MQPPTPMLRQYEEIKRQHPGTLLFFRLGDFYELFFDDAVIGAKELEITLTARHRERGNPVPMCGVPYHAASGYIAKLVRKGYRVAICEQTEDPKKATKLVKREVVRIITPGTAIDAQLLDARDNTYLAAVFGTGTGMSAAFLDLSTGEFVATQFTAEGAVLHYVRETQKDDAAHITGLSYFEPAEFLMLDAPTVRNLELVEALDGSRQRTLLGVLDESVTGMGSRLLKQWLLRPSMKLGELAARLDAVD